MEKTWKPTAAGIMTIISGCCGIGIGVAVVQESSLFKWLLGDIHIGGVPVTEHYYVMAALSTCFIALGVIALGGGISALRRKIWGLALSGAILSLWIIPVGTVFGIIWMIPVGIVLGILPIVFLVISKGEFD